MRKALYILALMLPLLLTVREARGQAAVVIDPSQIAASATNAAEQFDYMLDQLGELADMGQKMNSVKDYIDGIFGEDGIGGKAINVLQDLGTLDRLTKTYNMSLQQLERQAEMMKEMEQLRFADINMMLSTLRSAKSTLELAIVTAKNIINTMGLTKKEKKDEMEDLIKELQKKIDSNRKVIEIEYAASMEAQALDEFIRHIDRSMSTEDFVGSKKKYGTLDDAGSGSIGLINLLLSLLCIVCTVWGTIKTILGGLEGDPVTTHVLFRVFFISMMSMLILDVFALTFGFNI